MAMRRDKRWKKGSLEGLSVCNPSKGDDGGFFALSVISIHHSSDVNFVYFFVRFKFLILVYKHICVCICIYVYVPIAEIFI